MNLSDHLRLMIPLAYGEARTRFAMAQSQEERTAASLYLEQVKAAREALAARDSPLKLGDGVVVKAGAGCGLGGWWGEVVGAHTLDTHTRVRMADGHVWNIPTVQLERRK